MATPSEHTPLGNMAERYWVESRRPLASLVFIIPLLITYELGVLLLGAKAQNGADAFLRRLLDLLGFGQHFLLPVLTVCILLGWHYLSREPWQFSGSIISTMAVESIVLGVGLHGVLFLQNVLFHMFGDAVVVNIGSYLKGAVGMLGAGIYEELLFRLILLSLVAWALRHAGATMRVSMILAAIFTSLLFSAAHYRNVYPGGDVFTWFSFTFRFLAGMFFSIIFIYRGFGIAAGSHAAYDILVGLLG